MTQCRKLALVALVFSAGVPVVPVQADPLGRPGRAKVCLTDDAVKLKRGETLAIPATTIFEDEGANEGKRDDVDTWRHETQSGEMYHAAFATMAPITLTAQAKCAEVDVSMSIGPLHSETSAKVAAGHLYSITDIVDYPIPKTRPPVELGKLIDDISVMAVLLTDVSASVPVPPSPSEEAQQAACLDGATKLATAIGGGIGDRSKISVHLGSLAGANDVAYTCATYGGTPGLFVAWDKSARPSAATGRLIARAGAMVTGATPAEIAAETAACVREALKPDSNESANREFRGVKIECGAFERDGGGGTVDVYRRFGAPPSLPAPTVEARKRLETASQALAIEAERKAADTRRFVEWYENPSLSKEVKVFAMMASRITALDQRCPSGRSHADVVAGLAKASGITPEDLSPGGRYYDLVVGMTAAAMADAAKDSVATACEAAAKYDAVGK